MWNPTNINLCIKSYVQNYVYYTLYRYVGMYEILCMKLCTGM
jgi:hypothetical protein